LPSRYYSAINYDPSILGNPQTPSNGTNLSSP
jgi:hypothetical protein